MMSTECVDMCYTVYTKCAEINPNVEFLTLCLYGREATNSCCFEHAPASDYIFYGGNSQQFHEHCYERSESLNLICLENFNDARIN
jgi:hypothetical protein